MKNRESKTQRLLLITLVLFIIGALCVNLVAHAQTLSPLTDNATPVITPVAWIYLPLLLKNHPPLEPTPTLLPGQPTYTPQPYPSPYPSPNPNPTAQPDSKTYLPVIMSNYSQSLLQHYLPLYLSER